MRGYFDCGGGDGFVVEVVFVIGVGDWSVGVVVGVRVGVVETFFVRFVYVVFSGGYDDGD